MTDTLFCCARVASGTAIAAPAKMASASRRCIPDTPTDRPDAITLFAYPLDLLVRPRVCQSLLTRRAPSLIDAQARYQRVQREYASTFEAISSTRPSGYTTLANRSG